MTDALPSPDEAASLLKRLTEPKNLVALGIIAVGLGMVIGAKLNQGGEPFVKYVEVPGPERVVRDHRCADCAEKEIKAARVFGDPVPEPEPFDQAEVDAPRVFSPYDHPAAGSDVPEDD